MYNNKFEYKNQVTEEESFLKRSEHDLNTSLIKSERIGRNQEVYLSKLEEENHLYSETVKKLKKKLQKKKQKIFSLERQIISLQDDLFSLETKNEKLQEKLKGEQRRSKKYKSSMNKNKREKKRYKEKYRAERYANGKNPYTNSNQKCIPMNGYYCLRTFHSDVAMLKRLIKNINNKTNYIDVDYVEV